MRGTRSTFTAVEWTENQRVFTNRGRNGQELPPPEPRTARTLSRMARAGEEERGYRQGPFVPVGSTNRDQIPPFVLGPMVPDGASNRDKCRGFGPGWWLQPRQKRPNLYPLSSSPRPSHSAQCSCCSWLGWGEFLPISSTICEDSLIPCPFNSYKG